MVLGASGFGECSSVYDYLADNLVCFVALSLFGRYSHFHSIVRLFLKNELLWAIFWVLKVYSTEASLEDRIAQVIRYCLD